MADDDPKLVQRRQRVAAALQILDDQDTYAASRWIERSGDPAEVLQLYHDLVPALYFQRHDIRSMIAFARAGIHYGLTEAERIEAGDRAAADRLRGSVKAIAYDLGANLWPGWEEPGIELSAADLVTGYEAARLNLQLAESLQRPPLARCNAHWLVGAYELARGDARAAAEQFQQAAQQAEAAQTPEYLLMCRGYLAIAEAKQASPPDATAPVLAEVLEQLRRLGSEDAHFFADQLEAQRFLWLR